MIKKCNYYLTWLRFQVFCLLLMDNLTECSVLISLQKLTLPKDNDKLVLKPNATQPLIMIYKDPLVGREGENTTETTAFNNNATKCTKKVKRQTYNTLVKYLLSKDMDTSDETRENNIKKHSKETKPTESNSIEITTLITTITRVRRNKNVLTSGPIKLSFDDVTTEPILMNNIEPNTSYIPSQRDRDNSIQDKELKEYMGKFLKPVHITEKPQKTWKTKHNNPFASVKAYFQKHHFFSDWGTKISNFFKKMKKTKKSDEVSKKKLTSPYPLDSPTTWRELNSSKQVTPYIMPYYTAENYPD